MTQPTQFLSQASFQLGDPSAKLKPGVYLDNIALYDPTGGSITFGCEFEKKIWGNLGFWKMEYLAAAQQDDEFSKMEK